MISLTNRDSVFVKAKGTFVKLENKDNPYGNIKSFKLTEEIGKTPHANITMQDNSNVISAAIRAGSTLLIEWGYAKPAFMFSPTEQSDQLKGGFRRAIHLMVAPGGMSWDGDQSGNITYSFNMFRHASEKIEMSFPIGGVGAITVGAAIMQIATIGKYIPLVQFKEMTDVITPEKSLNFSDTVEAGLRKLAVKYPKCKLKIGHNHSAGKDFLIFTDNDDFMKLHTTSLVGALPGGKVMGIYYREKRPFDVNTCLCQSFSISTQGGAGDAGGWNYSTNPPTFQTWNAGTQTVTTYTINMSKFKQDGKDLSQMMSWINEYMSINDMDTLADKGYFIKGTDTTAPEGAGINIKFKCLGNAMLSDYVECEFFKNNFPGIANAESQKYIIRKVDHVIDTNGYFCDVEVQTSRGLMQ